MKNSPRTWYDRMDRFLMRLGFIKIKEDSNLYFKGKGGSPVMLMLYVDDPSLTREDKIIEYAKMTLST